MIARLGMAFTAGVLAGVLWLGFVGVPFVLPSYLEVGQRAGLFAGAAAAQQERGDAIEDLRGEEHEDAISSVETERSDCSVRLAARDALWSARLERARGEEPGTDEAPVCPDLRSVRDSLRDAGLADG